ncbi:MAG: hypothetical protein RR053_06595 [Evtepia sp.]
MLKVKKRTLILIAGIVWLLAGFNIVRLGVIAYHAYVSVFHVFLSAIVFVLFCTMFFRISRKHVRRILNYEEERNIIFRFFDLKSYFMMAFMMSGGIWLRSSGLAPTVFIAVFYTGLGAALALAGVSELSQITIYQCAVEPK